MTPSSNRIPAALSQMLRLQTYGRLRRMRQSFATPRRLALSACAALLACIWLGHVILSVLLREPYNTEAIQQWVRVGLTVYAVWHLIHTAWERPAQSLTWSPGEEDFLVNGPFTRRQLVQYRLLVICCSAVFKATFATVLLLPDLQVPWLGLIGLCIGLTCVEFVRVGVDTITVAMKKQEYLIYRSIVLSIAAVAVLWASLEAVERYRTVMAADNPLPPSIALISAGIQSLQALGDTALFHWISSPFEALSHVIVSADASVATLLQAGTAALAAWLFMEGILWLDGLCNARRLRLEADSLSTAIRAEEQEHLSPTGALPRVMLGAVTWRQIQGVRLNLTGVLLALVAPAILSFIPFWMLSQRPQAAFGNFAASLAFYTFLLLPPALKFDFRRDFDRLLALKMLPLSPWRLTMGQIATPVLIATIFQWTMILLCYIIRPISPQYVIAALALFIPANLIIFGIDNLLFLLFPHRLKQEGIDVFLRTTLVFTAKGLVFAILLVGALLWAVVARNFADHLQAQGWMWCEPVVIFGAGLLVLASLAAAGSINLASHAFRHFDPSRGSVA